MFIGRQSGWIKLSSLSIKPQWRTSSNDKISEVISRFASVQSNSVALEGSCQSMVYRSVLLITTLIPKSNDPFRYCTNLLDFIFVYIDFFLPQISQTMPGKRKRGSTSVDTKLEDGERSPTPTGSSKKVKKELQYDPVSKYLNNNYQYSRCF